MRVLIKKLNETQTFIPYVFEEILAVVLINIKVGYIRKMYEREHDV